MGKKMRVFLSFGTLYHLMMAFSFLRCLSVPLDVDLLFAYEKGIFNDRIDASIYDSLLDVLSDSGIEIRNLWDWGEFFSVAGEEKFRYHIYVFPENIPFKLFGSFWRQFVRMRKRPLVVIYDEGLGSYISTYWLFLQYLLEGDIRRAKRVFGIASWRAAFKILLPSRIYRYALIGRNRVSLGVNSKTVSCYKSLVTAVFERYMHRYFKVYLAPKISEKRTVLFLTQPFVEDGMLESKDYIEVVSRVVRDLNDKGFFVLIKPHPREDLEKYGFLNVRIGSTAICEKDLFPDFLLLSRKIDFVMGFNTTFLAVAKLVYGVPAVSLWIPFGIDLYTSRGYELLSELGIKVVRFR